LVPERRGRLLAGLVVCARELFLIGSVAAGGLAGCGAPGVVELASDGARSTPPSETHAGWCEDPEAVTHHRIEPIVFYIATPVVLISTGNADSTANLAPMLSAWWLGRSCMLGLGAASHTAANLARERQAELNLVQADLVDAVDRIALLTGTRVIPERNAVRGYRYEPRKPD
jgi:hypothetical protein